MRIRACVWKNDASINGRVIRTDEEAQEVIDLFRHGIAKLEDRIDEGFYTREEK